MIEADGAGTVDPVAGQRNDAIAQPGAPACLAIGKPAFDS